MDSVDGAKGVHVSSDESFAIDCDPCKFINLTRSRRKQQPIARNARNIYVSRVELYMGN